MLNKEIPFIRIVVPLCAGIIVGLWVSPGVLFFVIAAILMSALLLVSRFFDKSLTNPLFGITACLSFFLYGLFLYTMEKNKINELPDNERIYVGVLEDYPTEKTNSFQLEIRLCGVMDNDGMLPVSGKIVLYHDKEINDGLIPGNIMIFRFSPVRISNKGNPCEFDYRFYMENQGFKYYGFSDSEDIIELRSPKRRRFRYSALIFREKLLNIYRSNGIEGDRLAIIAAITLGEKGLLEQGQKEIFSKAGIMHIMAVSGLHAGIVSLLVSWLLFFLKGKLRPVRDIAAIAALWAFAFVTGLAPSVLRAGLMFSFLIAGRLMKRPVNPLNSLLASAFILIIASPSVIFSTGFQLSYMAVFYIISFEKHLSGIIDIKKPLPAYIWRSASTAVTAQAGTLPLTITSFNKFPTWFIFSNVLILPVATAALITGFLTLLTSPVHTISLTVAGILDKMIQLTEYLTKKAAALPLSTIDNIGMTVPECIILIVVITTAIRYMTNRKRLSPILPLITVLVFTATVTIKAFIVSHEDKIIVYNTIGYPAIAFQTGKNLILFSDSSSVTEAQKHKATMGLDLDIIKLNRNPVRISALGKKVMITGKIDETLLKAINPDILLLKGRDIDIADDQYENNSLDAIIISEEVYLKPFQREILSRLQADTIHPVNDKGAFIVSVQ